MDLRGPAWCRSWRKSLMRGSLCEGLDLACSWGVGAELMSITRIGTRQVPCHSAGRNAPRASSLRKGETTMSSGTLIILIVLAIVLFGGGGGYFWSRRRR